MDDVFEAICQGIGFGGYIVCDCAWWSVDFSHFKANVSSGLCEFLTGFLMNHVVKPFSSRKSIVCRGNEDVSFMLPDVSADNA